MEIWIDADACPRVVKDILFRTADRLEIVVTLVADRPLQVPSSTNIKTIAVPAGVDAADDEIVRLVQPGDLVITADVPLAAAVIEKGGLVIDHKGHFFNEENISEHLSMRNFIDELRTSGVETGGPKAYSKRDREAFARCLDVFLAKGI